MHRHVTRFAVTIATAATVLGAPLAAQASTGLRDHQLARPGKAHAPKGLAGVKSRASKGTTARAALCVTPTMTGNWHNTNPNTGSVTRVVLSFSCGDVVLCDTDGNCTTAYTGYYVDAFGACVPTDCVWGRQKAVSMGDGWLRATYNFGFATDYVWMKTYDFGGTTYLRVWVYTDFSSSDGRTDFATDEWFLR